MNLHSFVSRVFASLRRSKPCGCAYPAGWSNDAVPHAHRVNDEVTDGDEYVVEYKCDLCAERFEVNQGQFID
jgi:hypothetical protein